MVIWRPLQPFRARSRHRLREHDKAARPNQRVWPSTKRESVNWTTLLGCRYVSAGRCIGGFVVGASSLIAPVLSWIKVFGVFVGADHCQIFLQGLDCFGGKKLHMAELYPALADCRPADHQQEDGNDLSHCGGHRRAFGSAPCSQPSHVPDTGISPDTWPGSTLPRTWRRSRNVVNLKLFFSNLLLLAVEHITGPLRSRLYLVPRGCCKESRRECAHSRRSLPGI